MRWQQLEYRPKLLDRRSYSLKLAAVCCAGGHAEAEGRFQQQLMVLLAKALTMLPVPCSHVALSDNGSQLWHVQQ
jgi:hypothetical protein